MVVSFIPIVFPLFVESCNNFIWGALELPRYIPAGISVLIYLYPSMNSIMALSGAQPRVAVRMPAVRP